MTISETKDRIRHARRIMREQRDVINAHPLKAPPAEIRLSRADYDALEWGMGHLLKAWTYDVDAEGEIVKSTGRLIRINGLFTRLDGTENLMFKCVPVRVLA